MKELKLAARLKALKPGASFTVPNAHERWVVQKCAKVLRDAGVIEFQIVTRKTPNGFAIIAV